MPEEEKQKSILPEGFSDGGEGLEDVSEPELKFGYWFVKNKFLLRKALIGFLVTIIVGTFGFSLFSIIKFYVIEQDAYRLAVDTAQQDLVNIVGVHQANQILPLEIVSRHVLPRSNGNIDLVAKVYNPNSEWALNNVKYQFSLGGQVFDEKESFLLPGEEKYLTTINIQAPLTGTPQLLIGETDWQRVINYETWGPQRIQFQILDRTYRSARQSELSGEIAIAEATGQIINRTAFNYNNIEVQVGLLSGSQLSAISIVNLQTFLSGQTRDITARFTQNLPPITQVEIIPTVNIIDAEVYRAFEGEFESGVPEIPTRRF